MAGRVEIPKLTARSVILSALLGLDAPDASINGLLAMATELGLRESTVRVALTRLVAAGDLERTDGRCRLSPRLVERQRRQDRALHPARRDWDGNWDLAVVTIGSESSTDRALLRDTLQKARLGELREGVWARPANVDLEFPPELRRRLSFFRAVPEEASTELASRLFAPSTWAASAVELLDALHTAPALADRFEVAAAIVRHILGDPLLPGELLPEPWPGDRLREGYEGFRNELTGVAARHLTPDSA
ncbi:PaaX family transcriptional regulator C-terminal domain-containing protein [Gordonia sp. NPDC058843]|uniref:PaaX family transcriptional regulator C-terminal domain-containing protein n=1 Tax=Gordonia sp. NPDC058843 TaxID=3346648 RepID=UPI00369D2227